MGRMLALALALGGVRAPADETTLQAMREAGAAASQMQGPRLSGQSGPFTPPPAGAGQPAGPAVPQEGGAPPTATDLSESNPRAGDPGAGATDRMGGAPGTGGVAGAPYVPTVLGARGDRGPTTSETGGASPPPDETRPLEKADAERAQLPEAHAPDAKSLGEEGPASEPRATASATGPVEASRLPASLSPGRGLRPQSLRAPLGQGKDVFVTTRATLPPVSAVTDEKTKAADVDPRPGQPIARPVPSTEARSSAEAAAPSVVLETTRPSGAPSRPFPEATFRSLLEPPKTASRIVVTNGGTPADIPEPSLAIKNVPFPSKDKGNAAKSEETEAPKEARAAVGFDRLAGALKRMAVRAAHAVVRALGKPRPRAQGDLAQRYRKPGLLAAALSGLIPRAPASVAPGEEQYEIDPLTACLAGFVSAFLLLFPLVLRRRRRA